MLFERIREIYRRSLTYPNTDPPAPALIRLRARDVLVDIKMSSLRVLAVTLRLTADSAVELLHDKEKQVRSIIMTLTKGGLKRQASLAAIEHQSDIRDALKAEANMAAALTSVRDIRKLTELEARLKHCHPVLYEQAFVEATAARRNLFLSPDMLNVPRSALNRMTNALHLAFEEVINASVSRQSLINIIEADKALEVYVT